MHLGINGEATGYENIVNLGILRGLTKKEAIDIIPDIESFTELGGFLKAPVRTYSTGMQMKLAFGVATAVSSDILLLDEIIGVGDAQFMKKAFMRMENAIAATNILVLTTHAEETIKKFCNKIILLEKGKVSFFGEIRDGLLAYKQSM